MLRLRRLAPVAVVLLLTVAVGAVAAVRPHQRGPAAKQAPSFRIQGAVRGLYPGAQRTLRLTVRNRAPFAIGVSSIAARVRGTRRCPARYLGVKPFRGHLLVPARGTRTVGVTAELRKGAPNSCQSARLHLTFRGRAVRR